MKLNELTGIKNAPKLPKLKTKRIGSDYSFSDNITDLMRQYGFKYIDSGAFGITFSGKDSVLKVFANDPAYEEYVKFTKSFPSQFKKFAPKISSVRSYPPNPEIKFVKMHYYYRILDNNLRNLINLFNYIIKQIEENNLKYQTFNDNEKLLSFLTRNNIYINDVLYQTLDNLNEKELELLNFMMFIADKNTNKDAFSNDLHAANFMLDNRNNIILIDPWATKEGLN